MRASPLQVSAYGEAGMASSADKSAGRIGWVDAVRALGACAIVLLHVLVSTNINVDVGTSRQVAYAIVGIVFTRWAVPAFFMLTGFLMLDPSRETSFSSALRHVRRMLLIIAIFGTGFALMEEVWRHISSGVPLGPDVVLMAVGDVLTMRSWDHLWFVYALVGVYLAVPVLQWVRDQRGRDGFLWFTLALFVAVLVVPTLFFGGVTRGPVSSFLWNIAIGITYCSVGGCLRRWELSSAWVAVGIGSALIMVLVSIAGIGTGGGDQGYIFLQGSCFACIYAVVVLLAIRRFVGDAPLLEGSPANDLARDSFGVYLIHPLFIHLFFIAVSEPPMVPVLYEAGLFAAILTLSVVATRVMRRIPVLDHLL